MSETPSICHVDRLDLSFVPKPWPFSIEHRAEIDDYFEVLRREKPKLWNGRVLLLHRQVLTEGTLRGEYLETDYASFAVWQHWGRRHAGVHDCFSAAAILTADRAFLLGVMAAHTFNGGEIYFPCGTPDPDDIVGGKVDLDQSVRRELKEETGLEIADFDVEPGWTMVVDGPLIAQIRVLHSRETAAVLRARILAYLASIRQPELADIRVVRSLSDVDKAMPPFIAAFLASRWAGG